MPEPTLAEQLAQFIILEGDRAYFDQRFAREFSALSGCTENDALTMVRQAASEYPQKGRNAYGRAIQKGAHVILDAWVRSEEFYFTSHAEFLVNRPGNMAFCWAVFLRRDRAITKTDRGDTPIQEVA